MHPMRQLSIADVVPRLAAFATQCRAFPKAPAMSVIIRRTLCV